MKNHFFRSIGAVTAVIIFSKLLGFVKQMVLASVFGAGAEMDAYNMASGIAAMLLLLITGYIGAVFIPLYNEARCREGEQAGAGFARNLMSLTALAAFALALLGILFAPLLVRLIAPGFTDPKLFSQTVALLRIVLAGIVPAPLVAITGAMLEAGRQFVVPKLSGICMSIMALAACLWGGVFLLAALAGAAAVLLQLLLNCAALRKRGFRFVPDFSVRNLRVRRSFKMALPVCIGTAAGEVSAFVDKMMASGLPRGCVTALSYADVLVSFAAALLITPLSAVVYPELCETAVSEDYNALRTRLQRLTALILFFSLPVVLVTLLFAPQIVRIVYQRGSFDARAAEYTARSLFFYILSLPALAVTAITTRIFYALREPRIPMLCGILTVILNILLDIGLVPHMGVGGLALATSVSASAGAAALLLCLTGRLRGGRNLPRTGRRRNCACNPVSGWCILSSADNTLPFGIKNRRLASPPLLSRKGFFRSSCQAI